MPMQLTIGCELEGFALGPEHELLDTLVALGGETITTGNPFEMITPDMGRSSIEFVTGVCSSSAEIRASFERLWARLPANIRPAFVSTMGEPVRVSKKSRAKAMIRALSHDYSGGARGVCKVAPWASTQYHIGLGERLMTDEGIFFLDLLNNIAPYAREAVINRYGVRGDDEHFMCWQGWGRPERVPAPRWFQTPQVLQLFVRDIPKLVTKRNGEWVVDNTSPSRIGDPESEGTLWWAARPRTFGIESTVEWRLFPSLEPEQAADLAADVLSLAGKFWSVIDQNPGVTWKAPGSRAWMYRCLLDSPLVPPRPLNSDEWWTRYRS